MSLFSRNLKVGAGDGTDASLHVERSDGTARILVEETSASELGREMLTLRNNGAVNLGLINTAGTNWVLSTENDGFAIRKAASRASKFAVENNGDVQAAGILTEVA